MTTRLALEVADQGRMRPVNTPDWPAPHAHGPVDATVSLPGSKSLTNRYLVLAALADGHVAAAPAAALARHPADGRGAVARSASSRRPPESQADAGGAAAGADWVITPARLRGPAKIDTGLAGTVMRFLPPVAALADGEVSFDGDEQARIRPMGPVLDGLARPGRRDRRRRPAGALPFVVHGTRRPARRAR